jgi:hypothetical protein
VIHIWQQTLTLTTNKKWYPYMTTPSKNFVNVRIMCLSWMKCQYAHCCVIDLMNYNWRCCSSTSQISSSHQSVTRDDIADIITHLVLIASTHCMSWLPWNDAISLGTLYLANQGPCYPTLFFVLYKNALPKIVKRKYLVEYPINIVGKITSEIGVF